jgi:hypothetical protein
VSPARRDWNALRAKVAAVLVVEPQVSNRALAAAVRARAQDVRRVRNELGRGGSRVPASGTRPFGFWPLLGEPGYALHVVDRALAADATTEREHAEALRLDAAVAEQRRGRPFGERPA